jgi:hypothetical protein
MYVANFNRVLRMMVILTPFILMKQIPSPTHRVICVAIRSTTNHHLTMYTEAHYGLLSLCVMMMNEAH